jgi:hypothetical protein
LIRNKDFTTIGKKNKNNENLAKAFSSINEPFLNHYLIEKNKNINNDNTTTNNNNINHKFSTLSSSSIDINNCESNSSIIMDNNHNNYNKLITKSCEEAINKTCEPFISYHHIHNKENNNNNNNSAFSFSDSFDEVIDNNNNNINNNNDNDDDGETVISFSHFLPRIELLPEKRFFFFLLLYIIFKYCNNNIKFFLNIFLFIISFMLIIVYISFYFCFYRFLFNGFLSRVVGSNILEKQIRQLKPHLHLFGHTHIPIDLTIDDIRYIQWPLGYYGYDFDYYILFVDGIVYC